MQQRQANGWSVFKSGWCVTTLEHCHISSLLKRRGQDRGLLIFHSAWGFLLQKPAHLSSTHFTEQEWNNWTLHSTLKMEFYTHLTVSCPHMKIPSSTISSCGNIIFAILLMYSFILLQLFHSLLVYAGSLGMLAPGLLHYLFLPSFLYLRFINPRSIYISVMQIPKLSALESYHKHLTVWMNYVCH